MIIGASLTQYSSFIPWAFTRGLVDQRMVFMMTFLYLGTDIAASLVSSIPAVRHTIAPLFLREALVSTSTGEPGLIAGTIEANPIKCFSA